MTVPNEITFELHLQGAGDSKWGDADKEKFGIFGKDLKFGYQWKRDDGNLVGYDTASGVRFGEHTFGDNLKEDASVEAVTEFENETNLVCCAVTYKDRSLLCCVDLGLSKVMHSIRIMRRPITCLVVIKHGSNGFTEKQKVHPHLRSADGLVAAGQLGGKILLIDMIAKHSNWWKHNEINPTSLVQLHRPEIDDVLSVQQILETTHAKGNHTAVILDTPNYVFDLEITAMEFCEEPMILIAGHRTGHFDIWSLETLTKTHCSEPTGGIISHIMCMLPEDDPRKLVYVWTVENGVPDSFLAENSTLATANLNVVSYKPKQNDPNLSGYEEIDTVACSFRLLFDSPARNADYVSHCISVSPISIDISNKYMSALNCTGLCSFVWSLAPLESSDPECSQLNHFVTLFDLGRWYAEEMPKQAVISDLSTVANSYLANSLLDLEEGDLVFDAKVCAKGTKKFIWPLNEEVTSHVSATSFSIMVLTESKILQFGFPGIQSYLFDKIDSLSLCKLMQPHSLFYECLAAGLMPEGVFDKKKVYSKIKVLEAIYEVGVNHSLLRFLRRCASEFFDGKYESAGLSTQHLFEWAWNKALDVKAKSDNLLAILYSGHELTLSDKNSHNQHVEDLKNITLLFQHVERESLLHTPEALQGLRMRIQGLGLVNEYLKSVQYFASSSLLPDASENGPHTLSTLKQDYQYRRERGGQLMVDILVERFGRGLQDLWVSHGGDGKYPPPSMQSVLTTLLLDTADSNDKHCLVLYFLYDLTKSFNMNTSLALGYKELRSSPESVIQLATSQFLWNVDHDKLQDALKSVEVEKLDPTWVETTYNQVFQKYTSKELYDLYRCIGININARTKKFVIYLFLENGLIIPGLQWTRKNSIGGFEPDVFAFFLQRTRKINGLNKLVAKELNLKPRETKMLYQFLKLHNLELLRKQLEEKIGSSNFVPYPETFDMVFEQNGSFNVPEPFEQTLREPIKSEEVQKLLKNSFAYVKQAETTPLPRHLRAQLSKPSILKASDSPAASPLHISSAVTPSPKRLRFQLPKNANVSTSSEDSSPISEGLLHYEFETPRVSTPKSAKTTDQPEVATDLVFEFSAPSEVRLDLENPQTDISPIVNFVDFHTSDLETSDSEVDSAPSPIEQVPLEEGDDEVLAVQEIEEGESNKQEQQEEVAGVEEREEAAEVEEFQVPVIDSDMFTDDEEPVIEFKSFAEDVSLQTIQEEEAMEVPETASPVLAPSLGIPENEEEVSPSVVDSDMFTDDEEPAVEYKSFANDVVLQTIQEEEATEVPTATMEISEDEEEEVPVADSNTTANESFFSTKQSPNSSNASFVSAFNATLTEEPTAEEEDDDLSICPFTKKRRSEIRLDLSAENAAKDESDDMLQFSPSKFWMPPALQAADPSSEQAGPSEVDLSHLPKPPQRPSPRRPLRSRPTPPKDEAEKEPEPIPTPQVPADDPRETKSRSPTTNTGASGVTGGEGSSREISSAELDSTILEGLRRKPKRVDSVFFRTIDSELEADMAEIEAEMRAKDVAATVDDEEEDEIGPLNVSEDEICLDETLELEQTVVLSSGGTVDTPVKVRWSPRKTIKGERVSESEQSNANTAVIPETPQTSPYKRFTRLDKTRLDAPDPALALKLESSSSEDESEENSQRPVEQENPPHPLEEEIKEAEVEPPEETVDESSSEDLGLVLEEALASRVATLKSMSTAQLEKAQAAQVEVPALPQGDEDASSEALESISKEQVAELEVASQPSQVETETLSQEPSQTLSESQSSTETAEKATKKQPKKAAAKPKVISPRKAAKTKPAEDEHQSQPLSASQSSTEAPKKASKAASKKKAAKAEEPKKAAATRAPKTRSTRLKKSASQSSSAQEDTKSETSESISKVAEKPATRKTAAKTKPKVEKKSPAKSTRAASKKKESAEEDEEKSSQELGTRTSRRLKAAALPVVQEEVKSSPTKRVSAKKVSPAPASPVKAGRATRSKAEASSPPSQGLALTRENVKKLERQLAGRQTDDTSSQESAPSKTRRGRSRVSSVGTSVASRASSSSPATRPRTLRSRSLSVKKEEAALRSTRGSSVASEKSSQVSTRGRKRNVESESEESVESGALRRSKRTKQTAKRGGKRVSTIPEERD